MSCAKHYAALTQVGDALYVLSTSGSIYFIALLFFRFSLVCFIRVGVHEIMFIQLQLHALSNVSD